MENLCIGDRISLTFDDAPLDQVIATIANRLSDEQEGLGPESEDYVCFWFEITREGDSSGAIANVLFMTNGRYSLDGRFVTIRKIEASDAA
jgi:hypothetical protein